MADESGAATAAVEEEKKEREQELLLSLLKECFPSCDDTVLSYVRSSLGERGGRPSSSRVSTSGTSSMSACAPQRRSAAAVGLSRAARAPTLRPLTVWRRNLFVAFRVSTLLPNLVTGVITLL